MPALAAPPLLETDADGTVRVAGTGLKVRLLAGWFRYHGMGAAALTESFPALTREQAEASLAYYRRNRSTMDAEMDRREAEVGRARAEAGDSPFLRRLRLREDGRPPARVAPPPDADPILHGSQRSEGGR